MFEINQETCRDMSLLTFFIAATAAAVIGRSLTHPPDPDSLVCIPRADLDKMQQDIAELEMLREKLNPSSGERRLLADLIGSPDADYDDGRLQTATLSGIPPANARLRGGSNLDRLAVDRPHQLDAMQTNGEQSAHLFRAPGVQARQDNAVV